MWRDVVDFRDFYATPLGQIARRTIRRRVRAVWPSVRGMKILGIGFSTPYLRQFADEADRVMALMPAAQGVMPWPGGEPGKVVLGHETALPFADRSIDRVLLIHALEAGGCTDDLLQEIWRVLADGGRLLIVVPNRTGLWSMMENTPFGHGHPYTSGQLAWLLRGNMFLPEREAGALFFPPFENRLNLNWAPALEQIGERWFKRFAGVKLIEASKQYYVQPVKRERSQTALLLDGLRSKPAINTPVGTSGRMTKDRGES